MPGQELRQPLPVRREQDTPNKGLPGAGQPQLRGWCHLLAPPGFSQPAGTPRSSGHRGCSSPQRARAHLLLYGQRNRGTEQRHRWSTSTCSASLAVTWGPSCHLGLRAQPRPPVPLHFIPPRLNVNSKQAAIGRVSADARGEGSRRDRAPKSRIKVFSISEADSEVTPRTRPSPPIRSYSHPHQGRNPHLP